MVSLKSCKKFLTKSKCKVLNFLITSINPS
nr:MAG TPA: hypothetical protein [Caudoviricetes sp.]